MLKLPAVLALLLVPQLALASNLHRLHRERPSVREREPVILIGPVVACTHTHLFFGTLVQCENGLSDFDATDVPGF